MSKCDNIACDEAEARGYAAGVEAAAKRVRELHMAPPTEHPETCACPWCIRLRDIAEEVLVLLKSLPSPAPTTNSVEIGSKLVDEPAPSLLDEARQEAARSTFVCPCPGCMNPATYGKDRWREHVVQHMEEREKAEKERDEAIASCAAMRTILMSATAICSRCGCALPGACRHCKAPLPFVVAGAADQAGYLRGVAECEAIAEDYRARALADAVSGEGRPILTMLAGAAHVIRNHIRALRVKP